MKKNALIGSLLLLGGLGLFAQTAAEEAAIRQLIAAETQSFANESTATTVQKFWLIDGKTLKVVSNPFDGQVFTWNAAEMLEQTDVPEPSHAQVEKSDFIVSVTGDAAVVYLRQQTTIPELGGVVNHTQEVRILRKINGEWKIHWMSVHICGNE
jgi:hypothetical protein